MGKQRGDAVPERESPAQLDQGVPGRDTVGRSELLRHTLEDAPGALGGDCRDAPQGLAREAQAIGHLRIQAHEGVQTLATQRTDVRLGPDEQEVRQTKLREHYEVGRCR